MLRCLLLLVAATAAAAGAGVADGGAGAAALIVRRILRGGVDEPVKLSVEPEMKTRPWLLPCGRLVGDVRRRSGPASPTPGPTPPPLPPLLLRVGAFVGCVGVSEMLRLPADLIADYTRALEELKAVDVRLLRRLLASLAWPFTFVASLRQLLLTLTVHALAFLF